MLVWPCNFLFNCYDPLALLEYISFIMLLGIDDVLGQLRSRSKLQIF